jgi:hypothetical protein
MTDRTAVADQKGDIQFRLTVFTLAVQDEDMFPFFTPGTKWWAIGNTKASKGGVITPRHRFTHISCANTLQLTNNQPPQSHAVGSHEPAKCEHK